MVSCRPRHSRGWDTPSPSRSSGHKAMSNSSSALVVQKPGHGTGVYRGTDRLPNAIDYPGLTSGWGMISMITLRERTMLKFMDAVTDKPDWEKKVFDEEIVAKWRADVIKYNHPATKGEDRIPFNVEMTVPMFEYSIKELRYRAEGHPTSPNGAIYCFPGQVYKSDSAVSEDLKFALQEAVKALEDAPESQMDWHPGSDGKVLDLVHPSLFPLVYEKTRVLPIGSKTLGLDDCIDRIGEGEILPKLDDDTLKSYSRKFQWLPCDVDITGERPRIGTYINNLHPKHHSKLYNVVEDIIAAAIPLWEGTLTLVRDGSLYDSPRRIEYTQCKYHDVDDAYNGDKDEEYPTWDEEETEEEYDARVDAWLIKGYEKRRVVLPEPPSEFDPDPLEVNGLTLREEVGNNPLQIIVKLANIVLTPEKPEYGGGTWHVEGMSNEAICATAIYYYSCENITESMLCFRQQSLKFSDEVSYAQGQHDWVHQVYGLMQHRDTVQDLGGVVTREGRLVTFPNILQHQVQPFKLKDPTKPGHRKILVLFLVDPTFQVISTADVPPQRHDWWAEKTFGPSHGLPVSTESMKEFVKLLPQELKDVVLAYSEDDFPITMERAKEYREDLMEERKSFDITHQNSFSGVQISLCEH